MRRLHQIVRSGLAPALAFAIGIAMVVVPGASSADEAEEMQAPDVAQEPERRPSTVIEEITVTARHQEEGLQDVPVAIAAFGEEDLQRYNVHTLTELSSLVPNFQIFPGNSGNGSHLYLRGVGSTSISAAFDQSVAINIDGVLANRGRLLHNSYLDMGQLEVLKGPQSLYFGKSATAGVVSITTKDPGDEFELELMAAHEIEHDQIYTEAIVSGPITDTFGARLALGWRESDEMRKNRSPSAKNSWRGEEDLVGRLTLVWDPTEDLRFRFKYHYSEYENDGGNWNSEATCVNGVGNQQNSSAAFGGVWTLFHEDCKANAISTISDLGPGLAAGNPLANGGVPYLDQETSLYSLKVDWNPTPELTLTSISSYLDLDHKEFDNYCYCDPTPDATKLAFYGGGHNNVYKSFSQELRLASDFDSPLNFMVGAFYQDIEQEFIARQYASNAWYLFGNDPVTGKGNDWDKNHFLDTTTFSYFVAGYWDISPELELTAGVRYTDEDRDGKINISYMHSGLVGFGFLPAGTVIDGLDFDDSNWSPEVALTWHATDDISLYAAYKQGFKSGGVDNSALPSASLNPANPAFDPSNLIYDSEEAKGGEIGMKANFLDQSLRLNATVFHYIYDDLQVQRFDGPSIQFFTFNASEMTTEGFEADWSWVPPIEGLVVRGALAYTEAEYTDTFIQEAGEDLDGEPRESSAEWTGYIGATYDWNVTGDWMLGLSGDLRYTDDYPLENRIGAFEQDSEFLYDAAIRLYSEDSSWELAIIGRNLGDEILKLRDQGRPGAIPPPGGLADRHTNTSQGRMITAQVRYRF
jgi:iron complex outermembrane receptor protein